MLKIPFITFCQSIDFLVIDSSVFIGRHESKISLHIVFTDGFIRL